jgi:hypothetical protein
MKDPEIGESLYDANDLMKAEFKDYKGRTWRITLQSWQTLPISGGTEIVEDMFRQIGLDDYKYTNKLLVVLEYDDIDTAKLVYSYDDRRIGVMTAKLVE